MSLKSSSDIRSLGSGEAMLELLPNNSAEVFRKSLEKDFPRDG
jgi:hypothetical protein